MIAPFIQAAHFSKGRGGFKPRLIVIHTMETPESIGRAKQVTQWFAGHSAPAASAHWCIDNTQIYQAVKEEDTAWAVDDFILNQNSISIELAGAASQNLKQWNDVYSLTELHLLEQLLADISHRWAIPLVRAPIPAILSPKGHGVCGHVDITIAKHIRGGHTDPGPNFPYSQVILGAQTKFKALG